MSHDKVAFCFIKYLRCGVLHITASNTHQSAVWRSTIIKSNGHSWQNLSRKPHWKGGLPDQFVLSFPTSPKHEACFHPTQLYSKATSSWFADSSLDSNLIQESTRVEQNSVFSSQERNMMILYVWSTSIFKYLGIPKATGNVLFMVWWGPEDWFPHCLHWCLHSVLMLHLSIVEISQSICKSNWRKDHCSCRTFSARRLRMSQSFIVFIPEICTHHENEAALGGEPFCLFSLLPVYKSRHLSWMQF